LNNKSPGVGWFFYLKKKISSVVFFFFFFWGGKNGNQTTSDSLCFQIIPASNNQPLVFRFFKSWLKEPTSGFLEITGKRTGSFREGIFDRFLDLHCRK
jgi:hypothetical protein